MPLPIFPCCRAVSSARETSPRTSSSRSQSALRRSFSHSPRSSGKVTRCTLSGLPRPGMCDHTSSDGEGQDRRHQPGQRGQHLEADGLRGAAPRVVGRRHVEPVLDDVEVERREIHRAEVVEGVKGHVELVVLVRPPHPRDQPAQAEQGPVVELVHVAVGAPVALGVEVGEGAEEEARGVPDPPVGVGEPVQDLEREADVLGVVLGRHPQAQDLRAVLRDELVGGDVVAPATWTSSVPRRRPRSRG